MVEKSTNSLFEAEKAFKKGNSAIKTSIIKWKPDYLEGAMFFEKAAKGFKDGGLKDKAVEAYLKYSLCSEKINEFYGAAEGLAEAAFCEKDKEKSLEYLKRA